MDVIKDIRSGILFLKEIEDPDITLCFLAVEVYGPNLEFVPEQYKTFEMCDLAINGKGGWGPAIRFVPLHIKSVLEEDAVRKTSSSIQYISPQPRDLCVLSVTMWWANIEYIENRDEELYQLALNVDPDYRAAALNLVTRLKDDNYQPWWQ